MDRKKFLSTLTLSAVSISVLGQVKTAPNNHFVGDCETTNDILGPFYRKDAPLVSDLTIKGKRGAQVELSGRVLASDCTTPLENAMVEIWHCDAEGDYDNDSNKFHHRGRQFTDKEGKYAFKTILPGKYLNGKLFRPAHIHFRITAKGKKELISQIYFKGDPHIVEDPWASQGKAENRILPISLQDTKGNLSVQFDIYLSDK